MVGAASDALAAAVLLGFDRANSASSAVSWACRSSRNGVNRAASAWSAAMAASSRSRCSLVVAISPLIGSSAAGVSTTVGAGGSSEEK